MMKAKLQLGTCVLLYVFTSMPLCAVIRYVNVANPTPLAPYTSWATAATVIQDAVDVAAVGDEVVVTNGVYQTGGRTVNAPMTNRVAVTKPLTLRSVNGPDVTVIRGYQVPGTTNGPGAIRCAYLASGAVLVGFTLTGGATAVRGWAIPCESDYLVGGGGGAYCGAAVVSNCVFTGNSAVAGGGTFGGTLYACLVTSNTGGGCFRGTINNCTLSGNSGGGAAFATLNNCVVTGNSSSTAGGGTYGSVLNNCTVTGNVAEYLGGGAYGSTMNNCIVYFNTAAGQDNNTAESTLNYSCTVPLPTNGAGNISADPQLASASHLGAGSPCRGAGNPAYATGVDIDGEMWATPPSMGCGESVAANATGPLTVTFQASFTNVTTDFQVQMTAQIFGRATANRWEFGDGTVLSNRLALSHNWSAPGDYRVILRAFNQDYPAGRESTAVVHVANTTSRYVAPKNGNPIAPYTSWETAAQTIQDAIDVAFPGDEVVVTNGIYQSGGRAIHGTMTNRVVVIKPLMVRSVNGPDVTIIRGEQASDTTNGAGAVRCVYLTNQATLVGFTLTNGSTLTQGYSEEISGGGLWSASRMVVVSNCVLLGNTGRSSGGAFSGTLKNCLLVGNSSDGGGGATYSTLIDCTLRRNSGGNGGGGALSSILINCTVAENSASRGGGVSGSTLTNCVLKGNRAEGTWIGYYGGGAANSILYRCTLIGNSASDQGGGAFDCTLNSCLLIGNSAAYEGAAQGTLNNCSVVSNSASITGGGTIYGTLNNCIMYYNSAPVGANHSGEAILNYSCTSPLPTNGVGNITNAPRFVDAAAGDYRLRADSPCINAGRNAYAPTCQDLDGNPRITGGTSDLGAYEFQSPQSALSYAWLQQYGLPADGSADLTDPDGDGQNNWQECRAGTDPTNSVSALRLLTPLLSTNGLLVRWQSVHGRKYFLERGPSLGSQGVSSPVASDVAGQSDTTIFTDTNAVGAGPFFYRVGVGE